MTRVFLHEPSAADVEAFNLTPGRRITWRMAERPEAAEQVVLVDIGWGIARLARSVGRCGWRVRIPDQVEPVRVMGFIGIVIGEEPRELASFTRTSPDRISQHLKGQVNP